MRTKRPATAAVTAALVSMIIAGCTQSPPTNEASPSISDGSIVSALGCKPSATTDAQTYPGATEQEAVAAYKAGSEGVRVVLFASKGERPQKVGAGNDGEAYVDENAVASYLVFRGQTGVGIMSVYASAIGYYAVTTAVCP